MRTKLTGYETEFMRTQPVNFSFEHTGTTFQVWYANMQTLVRQEDGAGIKVFALEGVLSRNEILAKY